jgi:IS30 family transposase
VGRPAGFGQAKVAQVRDSVIELTEAGVTVKVIAERLGVTDRTVTRIRTRHYGGHPKAWPLDEHEREIAEKMLDDGCSYLEVGKTLGRNQMTISRAFPGRGWPPRQRGEYRAARMRAQKLGVDL